MNIYKTTFSGVANLPEKMSVTIAKIEPIVVSQTLDEPFYFSQWEYQKRTICLVKITTNTGIVGWGEGYGPFGIVKAAIEFFEPL